MIELKPDQLSELIGSIYDRAIEPGAWGETLGRMRTALGAEIGGLSLVDLRSRKFLLSFNDNIPQEWMDRLARNAGEVIDLWGGMEFFISHPIDEPVLLRQVNPAAADGKNSYRDEARAKGFTDAMSFMVARDDHVVGSCLFGRVRGTGKFREEEIALARLLAPHAQRAIAFSRMFELANLRADAFEAALEAAAVPTILVTDQSELIHANSAGHAALDQGDALRLDGNRIRVADLAHQVGLSRALETARDRPNADPRQLNVSLGSGASQLKLLPLPRDSARGTLAPSATAAIVLTGPKYSGIHDDATVAERLVTRHGLTRSEAGVALQIAKGDGRAAASARLGIRENTVRTHLSAIFHKLGINRQAQLVRLIDDVTRGGQVKADAPEAAL